MKGTRKFMRPPGYAEAAMSQSRAAVFLRGLRRERRRLLRQLKQIYEQVEISEAECRGLCYQAIKVMALSVLLESLSKKSTAVSNGVSGDHRSARV
ncbi:uncharacterized protein N7515_004058 [Penicillium bovifimosum]|uniref:Uncharacterized protein n=1 Tax=Penicillium bovifimosum TaxID=126998 RepID=A0A9W9H5U8_9EURO|nr:uncharacterized protein N7515_004058 [Penicillium bovifimosum]KAJ5139210.1 hypothetical protein N7515_004058 [Penicillium bovifimosum]